LPIGTYQVAIAYSFLSGTQCTRIRQATADGCIPAYRRSLFESNASPIIQAIELLSTAGLIERTAGGSAAIVGLSALGRSLLGSATNAAARTVLNLGDVTNTSDANKPVSTAQQTALNLKANTSALNLKADLIGGFVPSSQLPSFVDDVLEFAVLANFPTTGESGKIYIATDARITYRWSGSAYVEISESLALGTTSATAYRGDFGDTAYLHSQVMGNAHGVTAAQVGLGSLTNHLQVNTTQNQTIGGEKTFTGIVRITNTTASTSTTTGAHIVDGGQAVGGNQNIGGFTSLGDNVAIKVKRLTGGVTGATQGSSVMQAHGLTGPKIIGVIANVEYTPGSWMASNHTFYPGHEFTAYVAGSMIDLGVKSGNSANILSKPFVVLLFYIA
jgi:hypothetical protein